MDQFLASLVNLIRALVERIPRPLRWLRDLLGDGDQRIHALVILLITLTLCAGTLMVSTAILLGVIYKFKQPDMQVPNLIAELGLFVGGIGTLGGYIYNRGKTAEERKVTP